MKNKLLFLGFTMLACLFASAEINPVDVNLLHPCSNLDKDQSIPADTSQVILVSTECSHDIQADLNLWHCCKPVIKFSKISKYSNKFIKHH